FHSSLRLALSSILRLRYRNPSLRRETPFPAEARPENFRRLASPPLLRRTSPATRGRGQTGGRSACSSPPRPARAPSPLRPASRRESNRSPPSSEIQSGVGIDSICSSFPI
uniref:Uncharacterized protein n=1 Tax=Oryza meridionalis TaxID=40149 RepID=A0A0E0DZD0_9ORYZ